MPPIKGIKLDDLKEYGLVIYGAGVYAGMIAGAGRIKNWMEKSPEKTWVVFATEQPLQKQVYEELIFTTNFRKGESRHPTFTTFCPGLTTKKWAFSTVS